MIYDKNTTVTSLAARLTTQCFLYPFYPFIEHLNIGGFVRKLYLQIFYLFENGIGFLF